MNNISEDTAAVAAKETLPAVAGEPKIGPWTDDLTGKRFDRLLVQQFAGYTPKHHARWNCVCDCGNMKVINATHIKRGQAKSCGCLLKQCYKERKGRKTGRRHHPLWPIWRGMLDRTRRKTCKNYVHYGARGIAVCQEWQDSFEKFVSDMSPRPSPTHSLDRIDVNGNYSKNNCKWSTPKQQQNNRRCNHNITFGGETKTITEWADGLGLSATALRTRITSGWSMERAMTIRAQRKGPIPTRDRPDMKTYAVY